MAFDYSIDVARRRVTVVATGPGSYAEAAECARRLLADPQYQPEFGVLFDGSTMEYTASYEDALRFRDLFHEHREQYKGPIAVVVTGAVRYGVSRIISALADLVGVRLEVFKDLAGAERWLDEQASGA